MTGKINNMRQLKLSLLILTTILATSLPTYAQDQSTTSTTQTNQTNSTAQTSSTDLIGVGASLLNSLINPPSRSAEINADAEVRKAKIAADAEIAKEKLRIEASKSTDRVTPVLNQWGVTRIACAPGLVFINGITTDTVCIQPSTAMAAGYYTYDSAKQQLVRTSGGSQNASNTNVQNIQNVQTIRTVQTTKVADPSARPNRSDGGF
jgi:hypothetical protein